MRPQISTIAERIQGLTARPPPGINVCGFSSAPLIALRMNSRKKPTVSMVLPVTTWHRETRPIAIPALCLR
jgi:hypothetical protein